MGLAEVVPGVSGGTIAFITGIYERLLNVINQIRPSLWYTYRKEGIKGLWKVLDGWFLLWLMTGMGTGVIAGVFGLTWILDNYPQLLWSFFLGLILASSIFIGRQIKKWGWLKWILLIVGIQIAYQISVSVPVQAEPNVVYLIISGMIAISALILPGISGSFMLLVLGMYTVVIPALKDLIQDPIGGPWMIIVPFALGCSLGIVSIARLLSWTFKSYHDHTLAILTGFMIGSLHKIWPWRNVEFWINKRDNTITSDLINQDFLDDWVPLVEKNVLPGAYNGEPMIIGATILFLVGVLLLVFMERKPLE